MHSVFLIKIAWKICRIVSHHYIERILWIWFFIINQTGCTMYLNNRFVRERGLGSNPKIGIPGYSLHFPKEKKGLLCWLSQFSKTKLRQPAGQTFFPTSQENFPISFKPKVAIAKFIGKMQKKNLVLWKVGRTTCLFSS